MYFRFVAMLAEYGITGSLFYPLVKQRVKQKSNKLRLGSDHSQLIIDCYTTLQYLAWNSQHFVACP